MMLSSDTVEHCIALQVTIGSDTYVCITLGPLDWNNTGSYLQIAATLQADKLSSVKVPQCKKRSYQLLSYVTCGSLLRITSVDVL